MTKIEKLTRLMENVEYIQQELPIPLGYLCDREDITVPDFPVIDDWVSLIWLQGSNPDACYQLLLNVVAAWETFIATHQLEVNCFDHVGTLSSMNACAYARSGIKEFVESIEQELSNRTNLWTEMNVHSYVEACSHSAKVIPRLVYIFNVQASFFYDAEIVRRINVIASCARVYGIAVIMTVTSDDAKIPEQFVDMAQMKILLHIDDSEEVYQMLGISEIDNDHCFVSRCGFLSYWNIS